MARIKGKIKFKLGFASIVWREEIAPKTSGVDVRTIYKRSTFPCCSFIADMNTLLNIYQQ